MNNLIIVFSRVLEIYLCFFACAFKQPLFPTHKPAFCVTCSLRNRLQSHKSYCWLTALGLPRFAVKWSLYLWKTCRNEIQTPVCLAALTYRNCSAHPSWDIAQASPTYSVWGRWNRSPLVLQQSQGFRQRKPVLVSLKLTVTNSLECNFSVSHFCDNGNQ